MTHKVFCSVTWNNEAANTLATCLSNQMTSLRRGIMTSYLGVKKRSLLHQEDQLISRISNSRDNKYEGSLHISWPKPVAIVIEQNLDSEKFTRWLRHKPKFSFSFGGPWGELFSQLTFLTVSFCARFTKLSHHSTYIHTKRKYHS